MPVYNQWVPARYSDSVLSVGKGIIGMFGPKWKNSDPDVRVAAARELSDMEILQKMVATDGDWFVRHRVFDMIRDQDPGDAVYAFLARHAGDEEIRRKAVKKLGDEAELEHVAKEDKYRFVRDAAEHRLDELRRNVWGERPA